MKFMEKAKRFFTLSAKHEGFTLVELIVVIAILAILAGVAIPAYSGYIKKAQEAGDQTLLAAVNKAFAAACMVEGVDAVRVVEAGYEFPRIEVKDGKVEYVAPNDMKDHFEEFFAGNDSSTFKVITKLEFNPAKGVFEDAAKAEGQSVTFGNGSYKISYNTINAFKGSVFAQDVPAMQGQLTGISTAFGDFVGSTETAGNISPAFKEFMDKNGYGDEDLGNAAVLYVAQNAGNYTAQDIADMFQNCANYMETTGDTSLVGIMNGAFADDQDALTSAALMYGAVTAFTNSDKCNDKDLQEAVKNVSNGTELVDVFMSLNGNKEWESYIGNTIVEDNVVTGITASDQFTNDMNGFLGAMDAINTVSPDVKTDDANFWNSDEVNGLLGDLGFK